MVVAGGCGDPEKQSLANARRPSVNALGDPLAGSRGAVNPTLKMPGGRLGAGRLRSYR